MARAEKTSKRRPAVAVGGAETTSVVADAGSHCRKRARRAVEPSVRSQSTLKPRKALHAIRREEIVELLVELERLDSQMQALQSGALGVCGNSDATFEQAVFAGRVLRRTLQNQQHDLALLHRTMAEYAFFDARAGSPLHCFMNLPKEPTARYMLLQRLRDPVLHDTEQFFRSRLGWVDPRRIVRDQFSFEAPDGTFALSYVHTVQFEGAATVKGAIDAVDLFFRNIEIVLSEKMGSVTIREDDQLNDSGFSQNRLVSFTPRCDLVIESNNAVFSRFDEPKDLPGRRRGYGIAVLDFCDEDELYPYQPDKRARRDVNAIVEVTSWPRLSAGKQDGDSDTDEEVVCLIHWVSMHLHRPAFALPQGGWQELCEVSARWMNSLQFALHEVYVP